MSGFGSLLSFSSNFIEEIVPSSLASVQVLIKFSIGKGVTLLNGGMIRLYQNVHTQCTDAMLTYCFLFYKDVVDEVMPSFLSFKDTTIIGFQLCYVDATRFPYLINCSLF
ncbi:hypothetical protein M758_2G090900 [Ceratodon purpureus]|nr:hypothetical protein M758_2G090900 [Ceratodon purpureus]